MEVNAYYPYGMMIAGLGTLAGPNEYNAYKYNQKELQPETGWLDFGARMLDPVAPSWRVPDPMAESYYSWSPYNYALCNPVNLIDPNGMWVEEPDRFTTEDPAEIAGELAALKSSGSGNDGEGDGEPKSDQSKKEENQNKPKPVTYNKEEFLSIYQDIIDPDHMLITGMPPTPNIGGTKLVSYWNKIKSLKNLFKNSKTVGRIFTQTAKEGDIIFYSTKIGNKTIEFGGNFSRSGNVLKIKNFDIDGALTNQVGIKGLKEIITEFGKQQGVKTIIIEGAKRTTGANPGKVPSQLVFDIIN